MPIKTADNAGTRGKRRLRAASAGWAALMGWCMLAPATAQDVPLPPLPEAAERPATGPPSFLEGISRPEGAVEVKLGHGRILTLKEDLLAAAKGQPTLAVGDPGIVDFVVLSPRQIRLVGTRLGTTDLAVVTADGRTLTFEVRVVAELDVIRGQLRQTFPDANLKLGQVGARLVVEGQARDGAQVAQILRLLEGAIPSATGGGGGAANPPALDAGAGALPNPGIPPSVPIAPGAMAGPGPSPMMGGGAGPGPGNEPGAPVQVINLLRVPGAQQVLLKVRVAELNRTSFRQIGANVLGLDRKYGSILGTQIGGPATAIGAIGDLKSLTNPVPPTVPGTSLNGSALLNSSSSTTGFGIFQKGDFEFLLNALRRNSILKILAEPNLVALNGHQASFLAGGQFPVPVPQVGATGVASTITVQFKQFGVSLDFLPVILDGEVIRLTVDPVVSSIDFSIGTTLVAGGSPVPGLNTRQAHTTVELHPGETLAIAGLLQLTLDGTTNRIPGLGDLPILGPFFSNTTNERIEKELVVLVTPYLVAPMNSDQVPPGPGDEVGGPNDLEFYLLNRVEGRTGRDHRATTDGADPLRIGRHLRLERKYVRGPAGFSE